MEIVSDRMIRVGIADEHALARSGFVELLRSAEGITVVGEAGDGAGAFRIARDEDPDIIVVDLTMSDFDGLEITRQISERQPSVAMVILAPPSEAHHVRSAIEAGAKAYVLRTTPGEAVIATLRMVALGHVVLGGVISQALAKEQPAAPRLSARELEVLRLLARGLTNKQIADRLDLSRETIKTHTERIFRRLGAGDRTEAVALGFRAGLLE